MPHNSLLSSICVLRKSNCQRVENAALSTCWECLIVDVPRMSNCGHVENVENFQKLENLNSQKKMLLVTVLKMNSLRSLHSMFQVMNSRCVNSTPQLYTLISIYTQHCQFCHTVNEDLHWLHVTHSMLSFVFAAEGHTECALLSADVRPSLNRLNHSFICVLPTHSSPNAVFIISIVPTQFFSNLKQNLI